MAPLVAAATTAAELADPAEFDVPLVAADPTPAEDPLADVTTMPLVVEWCFGLSRVLFPFTTTDPPPGVSEGVIQCCYDIHFMAIPGPHSY